MTDDDLAKMREQVRTSLQLGQDAYRLAEQARDIALETYELCQTASAQLMHLGWRMHNERAVDRAVIRSGVAALAGLDRDVVFEVERAAFQAKHPDTYLAECWGARPAWLDLMVATLAAKRAAG